MKTLRKKLKSSFMEFLLHGNRMQVPVEEMSETLTDYVIEEMRKSTLVIFIFGVFIGLLIGTIIVMIK